ncbi:MAG: response regulator transcription factor, partial [Chloroflexota bacterium]
LFRSLVTAEDGPTGEALFRQADPSLVILDIMLPEFDGIELCKRIRATSITPIIMLTARVEEVEKAIGLGAGADDYVTKPYSPLELIARIKAQLRRAYDYQEPTSGNLALLGGPRLLLDPQKHEVMLDGSQVTLTLLEFRILEVLITNPGWAFSRNHLLEKIWGYDGESGEDTVTVHVSNLRKKLGTEPEMFIKTVRGVGYAYQED